jgi:hypothetical protein
MSFLVKNKNKEIDKITSFSKMMTFLALADSPRPDNDDDVYLDKLQTKGVKKSILYM